MPLPGDYVDQGAAAAETQTNNETADQVADLRRELNSALTEPQSPRHPTHMIFDDKDERDAARKEPQPYRTFDMKEIVDIFSHHPPTPETRERYERINLAFQECALKVVPLLLDGPGKTVAIQKLKEASMAANSAVALEGKF